MTWREVMRSPIYKRLPVDSCYRTYVRIMVASEQGRGVRLTPAEVYAMAILDNAVFTAASNVMQDAKDEDAERAEIARPS